MLLVTGHEVSHFVGTELRNREVRQEMWLNSIARIIQLEWMCFVIDAFPMDLQRYCVDIITHDINFYIEFREGLQKVIKKGNQLDFHTKESKNQIKKAVRYYEDVYLEKFVYDYCGKLRNELVQKVRNIKDAEIKISNICRNMVNQLRKMYEKLEYTVLEELLDILYYYMSESQADIIAILSMGISPMMYIQSFTKIDNIHDIQDAHGGTLMSVARVGIVMNVIKEVVEEERKWLKQEDGDFLSVWSGNIAKNTRNAFVRGSTEYQLATLAFGYLKNIKNYQMHLGEYNKIYNEEKGVQTYTNRTVDFVKDQYIYNELCSYGKACARYYIKKLKRDSNLLTMRNSLLNTYKRFAGSSVIEAMQEMEKFLANYESKYFIPRDA